MRRPSALCHHLMVVYVALVLEEFAIVGAPPEDPEALPCCMMGSHMASSVGNFVNKYPLPCTAWGLLLNRIIP